MLLQRLQQKGVVCRHNQLLHESSVAPAQHLNRTSLAGSIVKHKVCCGSSNFRQSFQSPEPGRSNQHEDSQPQPPMPPGQARDYSQIGNELSPYAQQRLATAGPSDLQPSVEAVGYIIEDESKRWPRLIKEADGSWSLMPGFLISIVDWLPPDFVLGSPGTRLAQLLCIVVGAWVAYTAFQATAAQNLNLALVLTVCWAREKLSFGRLLTVAALAWLGKLWMYWVFFVGARIDDLLKRIAPPIRRVCWLLFICWLIYIAVTPLYTYPLPWLPFAPGMSPFRGMGLMRI